MYNSAFEVALSDRNEREIAALFRKRTLTAPGRARRGNHSQPAFGDRGPAVERAGVEDRHGALTTVLLRRLPPFVGADHVSGFFLLVPPTGLHVCCVILWINGGGFLKQRHDGIVFDVDL